MRVVSALLLALPLAAGTGLAGAAEGIRYGVYDPDYAFHDDSRISIEHVFVQLQAFDPAALASAIAYASQQKRELLITLEPWTTAPNRLDGEETILPEVAAGRYDDTARAVCAAVGGGDSPVMIRFAQEMEDPRNSFPWAGKAPDDYIAAYRHIADLCRTEAPHARFVWSPAGVEGAMNYYPGDAYADLVSLSVFGLEQWDRDNRGTVLSVRQRITERAWWINELDQPIIVAEFGFAGGCQQESQWLRELAEMHEGIGVLDRLYAVVYFNAPETFHWPAPYGSPDWRIVPASLNAAGPDQCACPQAGTPFELADLGETGSDAHLRAIALCCPPAAVMPAATRDRQVANELCCATDARLRAGLEHCPEAAIAG